MAFAWEIVMGARSIQDYLATHAVANVFTFGVVREDEDVLAFGHKNQDGSKTRIGSISQPLEDHYLVLQYPNSEEEYRAKTLSDLGWFLWKLAECGDWVTASDWMQCNEKQG